MSGTKRIGILTGGGDCPGLNAAIRAVTKTALKDGYEVIGLHEGWRGFIDNDYEVLDSKRVSGIINEGGTILGSSRFSPFDTDTTPELVLRSFNDLGLEGLVVLGGEGTLSATGRMSELGMPVVGIPKTIDNDVAGTDYAIGFQTAVQIATDALDRLRTSAESHGRVMLLEVMGRTVGWIAACAGMANGADAILVPEIPWNEEKLKELYVMLEHRKKIGKRFSIVVVAEGVQLEGKSVEQQMSDGSSGGGRKLLGGVATLLGEMIRANTTLEAPRVTTLGYVQRGGTPVAFDRTLATSFGVKAAELLKKGEYGRMTAINGLKVSGIPFADMMGKVRTLDLDIFHTAEVFFG